MTDQPHGHDPQDDAAGEPQTTEAEADDAAASPDAATDARGPAPARVEYDEPTLQRYVEAMLFVAQRPLTVPQVARSLRTTFAAVRRAFRALAEHYAERGVRVTDVGGAHQFRTAPECADAVRRLLDVKPLRLSKAAMETLAVVAYRQPATKPDVDDIRGVDSGSAVKLLLDRNLVRVLGRKEEPGRPLLYGTTQAFLEFFALSSLSDLPSLREYTELTDDGKRQLERDLFARPAEPLKEYLEDASVPAPRARRWDDLVEVLGDDLGGLPEGIEVDAEAGDGVERERERVHGRDHDHERESGGESGAGDEDEMGDEDREEVDE